MTSGERCLASSSDTSEDASQVMLVGKAVRQRHLGQS
jgi:hypothetical protein